MKVTWRKRELTEAEAALKKMSALEGSMKLAYAVAKNTRTIGNEIQDLKAATQMPEEKYKISIEYIEKKGMISQDREMSMREKNNLIEDLDDEYPGCKHAIETHNREVEEVLREDIDLELYEMKSEWFPKKFECGSLGPIVDVVTGENSEG